MPGVADTLVGRTHNLRKGEVEQDCGGTPQGQERQADPVPLKREPGEPAQEPEGQRHQQQAVGRQQIESTQEDEAAEARARQIGEIDPAEDLLAPQEGQSQEYRARQEGREIEQEVGQQAELLLRIGDEEDRVEGDLLGEPVGRRQKGAEEQQADPCEQIPVPFDAPLAKAHDGRGDAEAQHGDGHHQRAEMGPAGDGEDAHDGDFERNDRARDQTDREIEQAGSAGRDPPVVGGLCAGCYQLPPPAFVNGTKFTILPL